MPPDPFPDPAHRVQALFAEFLAAREAGKHLDFDAFCRAHPDDAESLREVRDDWDRMQLVAKLVGEKSGSFAARVKHKYGEGADPEVSLDAGPTATPGAATDELVRRLSLHAPATSRYKLEGEVARGGMGAILKVWDEDLRRHLAMKVVLGKVEPASTGVTSAIDPKQLARFLEEAQITGQLDHPGIVPVHELGLDSNGRVYFTMKLVKGRDLKHIFDLVFEGKEGWNETRALGVILKVCEAMGYAHAKGVIHRDLKPANVMVGSFGEVFVMDWGLARVVGKRDTHDIRIKPEYSSSIKSVKTERRDEREDDADSPIMTMDGDVVGTPAYMPLEQARGDVERLTPRSDVYAIGSMLYHLIARQMPYVAPGARVSNRTVLARVLDAPPTSLTMLRKDVPAELVSICEKAMAREPEQRYPDVLALADDLTAFLEGRVVKAHRTGAAIELSKWIARNRASAAAIAAAALILVGGLTSISLIQASANARLERANNDLNIAKNETERSATEARYQSYLANIQAADGNIVGGSFDEAARQLQACAEPFRGWEWQHLRLKLRSGLGIPEVAPRVGQFVLSPDGLFLICTTAGGGVEAFSAVSGESLWKWMPPSVEDRAEFLSGPLTLLHSRGVLAVETQPGRIQILDSRSGTPRAVIQTPGTSVDKVCFVDDGRTLATVAGWIWRAPTPLIRNNPHVSVLLGESIIRLWDVQSGAERGALDGHRAAIVCMEWSEADSRLLSFDCSGCLKAWDVNALTCTSSINLGKRECPPSTNASAGGPVDHERAFVRAYFSGTGDTLATVASEGGGIVWSTRDGKSTSTFSVDGKMGEAVDTDEELAADFSTDDLVSIHRWNHAAPLQIVRGSRGGVRNSALSLQNLHIRFVDWKNRLMRVELDHGWAQQTLSFPEPVEIQGAASVNAGSLAWSPDGKSIACGALSGRILVWPAEESKASLTIIGGQFEIYPKSICWSSDGTRLLVPRSLAHGEQPWLERWRVDDGLEEGRINVEGNPCCMDASSDGKWIALGLPFGGAIILSTKGERHWRSPVPAESVKRFYHHTRHVRFLPDSRQLAYCGAEGALRIIDVEDGSVVKTCAGSQPGDTDLDVSRDGGTVAIGSNDGAVRLWDLQTGRVTRSLAGHAGAVMRVSFGEDGTRLASCGVDGAVRVWIVSSGDCVCEFKDAKDPFVATEFSPDGLRLAGLSQTGRLVVWESQDTPTIRTAWPPRSKERREGQTLAKLISGESPDLPDACRRIHATASAAREAKNVALSEVAIRYQGAFDLNMQVWPLVAKPGEDAASYTQAVHDAEAMVELWTRNGIFLNTLGVAYYRAGEYEKAVAALERSTEMDGELPADLAFLAMAEQRLGHTGKAARTLTRLRQAMKSASGAIDEESRAFLAEAEAMIEGASPQPR